MVALPSILLEEDNTGNDSCCEGMVSSDVTGVGVGSPDVRGVGVS